MTRDEYIAALKAHDWFFDFSDDYSVWKKGMESYIRIVTGLKEHDPHREEWNKVCPAMMRRGL